MKGAALSALECVLMALTLAGLGRTLSQMRIAEGRAAGELSRRIAAERAADEQARRIRDSVSPPQSNLKTLADLIRPIPGQERAAEDLLRETKRLSEAWDAWEEWTPEEKKDAAIPATAARFHALFREGVALLNQGREEEAQKKLEEAFHLPLDKSVIRLVKEQAYRDYLLDPRGGSPSSSR